MLLQALCIILLPSVNSNRSRSPDTPNLGLNRRFFCPVWPWNLMDDLKHNRAPLLCHIKLCASFHSHQGIQTRVTVRKHPNWGKICFDLYDLDLWPLTLTFHIKIIFLNGNNSRKFHNDSSIVKKVSQSDERTDRRTEVFLELLGRS